MESSQILNEGDGKVLYGISEVFCGLERCLWMLP